MEVVLAEVEGSESKSSEDGDAARGMLSYDWSDMFAVLCGSPDDREGAMIRCLLEQGRCVGVTAVFRLQRSLLVGAVARHDDPRLMAPRGSPDVRQCDSSWHLPHTF